MFSGPPSWSGSVHSSLHPCTRSYSYWGLHTEASHGPLQALIRHWAGCQNTHTVFVSLRRVRWMHAWNLRGSVPPIRFKTTAIRLSCISLPQQWHKPRGREMKPASVAHLGQTKRWPIMHSLIHEERIPSDYNIEEARKLEAAIVVQADWEQCHTLRKKCIRAFSFGQVMTRIKGHKLDIFTNNFSTRELFSAAVKHGRSQEGSANAAYYSKQKDVHIQAVV